MSNRTTDIAAEHIVDLPADAGLPQELSDIPSIAIRQALADLAKCEADPKYRIYMRAWHDPKDGVCLVCLAGSVLAKRFGISPREHIDVARGCVVPSRNMLMSLDDFRMGYMRIALMRLKRELGDLPEYINIKSYHSDKVAFYRDMHALTNDLEQHGH